MAKGKNFGGFGGGMNMQAMMKQAQKMQENMLKAQEEIAVMETTGTAGDRSRYRHLHAQEHRDQAGCCRSGRH